MITAGLVALVLVAADIFIRALRVRTLLGAAWSGTLGSAVAVDAYGDAASAITPARLGGEPARFLALRRSGAPAPAVVAVLATERMVDLGLAALVTLAAAGLLGARGFGDVGAYLARFTSPRVVPWVVVVAVLLVAAGAVAVRLRHRFPSAAAESLRDAASHLRAIAAPRFLAAIGLTVLSMAARVAILPVLLSAAGALGDPLTAGVGSFALIYAQLLLPTPSGAGGIELAFVVGLAPHLTPSQVTTLLVAWRVYTLVLPAGLGLGLWLARRPGGG